MVSLSHADRCLRPALQQCEAGKADEPRDVFSGHRTCFAFHEARQHVYKELQGCKRYRQLFLGMCSVEPVFKHLQMM